MKKNSKEKIARIYADALYAAAKESKSLNLVQKDTEALHNIFSADSTLLGSLSSPLLTLKEQKEVLAALAKKVKLHTETLRCLELMAEEGKLREADLVMQDFTHLCYKNNNIVEVVVETVKKLSATQDKKLQQALTRRLNSQVAIDYRINPSLIGGLRVQYGTYLIDASLSHKLNCLENVMKGK